MDQDIKIVYAEPADYFPEEIRKKYKLGEFAEEKTVLGRNVYIGKIKNDILDVKTLVFAESEEEAKEKVKQKFIRDLDVFYHENEIEVCLFSEKYK